MGLELLLCNRPEHVYTLAATGIKFPAMEFDSREEAKSVMYRFIDKHGLRVDHVYDDKHFKTYVTDTGVRFYINRV